MQLDQKVSRVSTFLSGIMSQKAAQSLRSRLQSANKADDANYREKVLRNFAFLLAFLCAFAPFVDLFIFRNKFEIRSYYTVELTGLFGALIVILLLTRKAIDTAALALFILILGIQTMVTVKTYHQAAVGTAYLTTLVTSAFLLPKVRVSILTLLVLVFSAIAIALSGWAIDGDPGPALREYGEYFMFVIISGVIINQLRVEFNTRLRTAEQQREVAERHREIAEKANQAKSQFLANMSHELRTPLGIMMLNIQLLLGGLFPEGTKPTAGQDELLEPAKRNGKRLLQLIDSILDEEKLESGQVKIQTAPSQIAGLQQIIDKIRPLAEQKSLALALRIDQSAPELVITDMGKVDQIVTNLVSNAIKFTDKGSVQITVDSIAPESWRVVVSDTGIGIPSNSVDKVFDRFFQVDDSEARKYQGSGLGLSIAKSLVELLQGSIAVTSTENVGSQFVLTLPRKPKDS